MTRILAIDPGLANTGVVFWDGLKIARAETWKTPSGGTHQVDFDGAIERCRYQTAALWNALHDLVPDVVVVEAYRDFPGGVKRQVANRWTTPLLIGYLISAIDEYPARLVFQDPLTVMSASSSTREFWKTHKGAGHIIEGDELLTNDHLRSAGAHLLVALNLNWIKERR